MTPSMFVPSVSFIQSIAQGPKTVVTFTAACNFLPGSVISFRISPASGMRELNNVQALVQSTTSNTITVNINSTNYTPFVYDTENALVFPAMVVPVGSGIIPGSAPATINLADAFDNVPIN